jgi:drug/metabolite transporter (DMT)-like permease
MIALCLALTAGLGWGLADFLGGLKSRRLPAITVLMFSNLFGLGVIGAIVWLRHASPPPPAAVLWATSAGVAAIAAMFLLYQGLARGKMAIVAPISATGVVLPIAAGLAFGESLTGFQSLGIASALAGSILAARGAKGGGGSGEAGVAFAAGAALATGIFFVLMDRASDADPYWASLLMRASFGAWLLPILFTTRSALKTVGPHLPGLIALGAVDCLASVAFAVATSIGLLSIVAVFSSLYPVVTVILSVVILHERPDRIQLTGVALALAGVGLVSV